MELTDEQKNMYNKMTDLQKQIVTIKVGDPLMKDVDVYKQAKIMLGKPFGNDRSCASTMSEILSRPNICEFLRIFEIDMSANDAIMSREEILEDLTMIAEANIFDVCDIVHEDEQMMNVASGEIFEGIERVTIKKLSDIDPKHRKLIKKIKQTKYGFEIELHDANAARKMLADMQGFNAPTKTEVTGAGGGPIQQLTLTTEQVESLNKDLEDEF